MKIALSSFRCILLRTYKNCRLCDFNSSGKIIFEEQKDNLVYNYGVAKCGKEKFAQLSSDDYIIHRTTNMSVECLVHDKEAFKRKYKNIIVDNATLEDIMLFYVKGGISCED